MSRSMHVARDSITSLRIVVPNWYVTQAAGPETATGATATVTASIEYPAGTFTQVLFSASATGSIPDNASLASDACTVTIPRDATFYVRIRWSNANGFIAIGASSALGDRLQVGAAVSDVTMSGSVPDSVAGFCFPPAAIVASTQRISVMLIGTSRTKGVNDTMDAAGDIGETARSIGTGFGYINGGVAGDSTAAFLASHARRLELAAYCSHVICEMGANDSGTDSAVEAGLTTLYQLFPSQSVFGVTIAPYTTGSWGTLGGQTVASDHSGVNDWIRTTPLPLFGYFEVADRVESARNSGKWKSPSYTTDGIHETQFANLAIKSSGCVAI